MIPTIETIVADLLVGSITKEQAIAWLHQHAEDAGRELRDEFAANAMPVAFEFFDKGYCGDSDIGNAQALAECSYQLADAMLKARKS